MGRFFRAFAVLVAALALVACGDGRGSQYSSARGQANTPPPTYIPVTPGATPAATASTPTVGPAPAAASAGTVQPLSAPVAVTPGATPIIFADAPTARAPASSLKPLTRGQRPVAIAQSSAPVRRTTSTATAAVARAPAAKPVRKAAQAAIPDQSQRVSRGPIYSACRAAGRKAASGGRCGCIQWVANRELSDAQQRRGAGYFKNPHGLQETRQSDNPGSERFWKAWKAYGQTAARLCAKT